MGLRPPLRRLVTSRSSSSSIRRRKRVRRKILAASTMLMGLLLVFSTFQAVAHWNESVAAHADASTGFLDKEAEGFPFEFNFDFETPGPSFTPKCQGGDVTAGEIAQAVQAGFDSGLTGDFKAYFFRLRDGRIAVGAATGNETDIGLGLLGKPDKPGITHISCSDAFGFDSGAPDGWGEVGAPWLPTDGGGDEASDQAVAGYAIYKFKNGQPESSGSGVYQYHFEFLDGTVAQGTSTDKNADIGLSTAIHLSCSDAFGFGNANPDGWGESGAPVLGTDPPGKQIVAYQIIKPNGDTCGFGDPGGEPQMDMRTGTITNTGTIPVRVYLELVQDPASDLCPPDGVTALFTEGQDGPVLVAEQSLCALYAAGSPFLISEQLDPGDSLEVKLTLNVDPGAFGSPFSAWEADFIRFTLVEWNLAAPWEAGEHGWTHINDERLDIHITVEGPPPPPPTCSLCADGKPDTIDLTYTGDSCALAANSQDSDKTSCTETGGLPDSVFIQATDKETPGDTSGNVWFTGPVDKTVNDGVFTLNSGSTDFSNKTFVHIFDPSGVTLLQSIEFHTSCSQPLVLGESFGGVRIGTPADLDSCPAPPPPPPSCDLCEDGVKPVTLDVTYLGPGATCGTSANTQTRDACSDVGTLLTDVFILATDKETPGHSSQKVWFAGAVSDGVTFTLDASNAGETELKKNTWIHIFTPDGVTLLQSVRIHTSCSDALLLGETFGAIGLGHPDDLANCPAPTATQGIATLSGSTWLDADGDGTSARRTAIGRSADAAAPAPDVPLGGIAVTLLDRRGFVVATTTSDATGAYSFTGLAPALYTVEFLAPPGYDFSPAVIARTDGSDVLSTAQVPAPGGETALVGETGLLVVIEGSNSGMADAGLMSAAGDGEGAITDVLVPATGVELHGFAFDDVDGDGLLAVDELGEPTELLLEGLEVRLLDSGNRLLAETTTDEDGAYEFTGLLEGQYRVEILAPFGYELTVFAAGSEDLETDVLDSDFDPELAETSWWWITASVEVTLEPGINEGIADAGFIPLPAEEVAAEEPAPAADEPAPTTEPPPSSDPWPDHWTPPAEEEEPPPPPPESPPSEDPPPELPPGWGPP